MGILTPPEGSENIVRDELSFANPAVPIDRSTTAEGVKVSDAVTAPKLGLRRRVGVTLDWHEEMNVNKEWHSEHPMPEKPTLEQRIAWHREHQQHCACRKAPESLRRYLEEPSRVPA
jgi:hypothetical protein